MIRAVLYALLSIFLIALVRMFVGLIGKAMRESLAETPPDQASGSPRPGATRSLKKCAVCGAYAPASSGIPVPGVDAFLCSDHCAGKFRV